MDQTTSVQRPAREHVIRASALKAVLSSRWSRYTFSKDWVALSAHIETGACGSGYRSAWGYRRQLGMEPYRVRSGISIPSTADMLRLVEKVRTVGGLGEVKRTWGIGYRALLAEIAPKRGAA